MEAEIADLRRSQGYALARDSYWGSLRGEEEKVIQAILDAAREHLDSLDPEGLNAAVRLLRDTGRGSEASELIMNFVRHRTGRMLAFTVDPTSGFAKVQVDPELGAALEAMFTPPIDDRPSGEVVRTIASQGRWSDTDIALLASQTPAQFKVIIGEKNGEVRKLVRLAVSMISTPGEEHGVLPEKLGQAREAISARSLVKERRLRAWDYIPVLEHENKGATVHPFHRSARKTERTKK